MYMYLSVSFPHGFLGCNPSLRVYCIISPLIQMFPIIRIQTGNALVVPVIMTRAISLSAHKCFKHLNIYMLIVTQHYTVWYVAQFCSVAQISKHILNTLRVLLPHDKTLVVYTPDLPTYPHPAGVTYILQPSPAHPHNKPSAIRSLPGYDSAQTSK